MSKKVNLYCIPGLGLDHRLFDLIDIPAANIHALDWLEAKEDESLTDYAKRYAELLPDDENICLLGVSLGGIMSVEIARIRPIQKIYLVSSVKKASEMPAYMSFLDKLPKKNKSAYKFALEASMALKPFYDKASTLGNELFNKMIKDASIDFINWGLQALAKWGLEEEVNCPFMHIHGTDDLIFPIKNIHQAITIKGGTHFAIHNNAAEISKWVQDDLRILQQIKSNH